MAAAAAMAIMATRYRCRNAALIIWWRATIIVGDESDRQVIGTPLLWLLRFDGGWSVCLHEMQLCMKPYVRGLLLNKRLRMSSALRHTTHKLLSQYHQVFRTRWRQCLESKAIWNLRTSMIDTIFGTVLDRLLININMKELVRMALFRRSYSIMNVGMADFASCRYDARRMRHSSSRHISIAQSIDYITI